MNDHDFFYELAARIKGVETRLAQDRLTDGERHRLEIRRATLLAEYELHYAEAEADAQAVGGGY